MSPTNKKLLTNRSDLPPVRVDLTDDPTSAVNLISQDLATNQRTALRAAKVLVGKAVGFHIPTREQRRALVSACADSGAVVYGRAFDIVRLPKKISISEGEDLTKYLKDLIFYEIKSTRRPLKEDFKGHFFSMSTAELLVAQSLGARFRFVFVNARTEQYLELSLTEIFAKARAIYPTWSIRF